MLLGSWYRYYISNFSKSLPWRSSFCSQLQPFSFCLYDVSIPCHSPATSVLHCRTDVSLWCALFDMSQTQSSIVPWSEKNRLFLVFTCLWANTSQDSMSSSIFSTSQAVSLISVMENCSFYRDAVGFLMASLAKVIIGCIHDFEGCAAALCIGIYEVFLCF